MVKKEYAEKKHNHDNFYRNWLIFLALALIVTILPRLWMDMNRIDSLEEEIASMPHYECWNETTTRRVTLNYYGNLNYTPRDWYFFWEADEEVDCEEGLQKIPNLFSGRGLENRGNEEKICIVKKTKEVCKLNNDRFRDVSEQKT